MIKLIWRKLYWGVRKIREHKRVPPIRKAEEDAWKRFDKLGISISQQSSDCLNRISTTARDVLGDDWNFYSGTLQPGHAWVFERVIEKLPRDVRYLEIGSASGISMGLIGTMLATSGKVASLTSMDPYYESGYTEGSRGPFEQAVTVGITKKTRDRARRLYDSLGLDVRLIEQPSTQGLVQLIRQQETFDLIYIDGLHEGLQPLIDLGLCLALLAPNGVVMLDDYLWPDVQAIKQLCDTHAEKLAESPKIAAYRLS